MLHIKFFLNFCAYAKHHLLRYNIFVGNEELQLRELCCSLCPLRDIDVCTMNKMKIADFVYLRLAHCPDFRWG